MVILHSEVQCKIIEKWLGNKQIAKSIKGQEGIKINETDKRMHFEAILSRCMRLVKGIRILALFSNEIHRKPS